MAESRTREPTPRRIAQARERAEVPLSRELSASVVLLVGLGVLWLSGGRLNSLFNRSFSLVLEAVQDLDSMQLGAVLYSSVLLSVALLTPFLLAVIVAALFSTFLQVGPLFSTYPFSFQWSSISPTRGIASLFTRWRFFEVCIALFRIFVVGWVAWTTLQDGLRGLVGSVQGDVQRVLSVSMDLALLLCIRVGCLLLVFSVLDLVYQRYRYIQVHKMSRRELVEERKQTEGDPLIRQQKRRMHGEIISHAALEDTRDADLLLFGPYDRAVALVWDPEEAPRVKAKARGELAWRMVQIAAQQSIPLQQDISLATRLFECEIGEQIPEALYEPVALLLQNVRVQRT